MSTAYQTQQAASIRQETAKRVDELQAVGAVARIGFYHYPGMHSNLNTIDTVKRYGRDLCVKGDDPMKAIVEYAKAIWGSGKLRSEGRDINGDGTYSESFLVIQG